MQKPRYIFDLDGTLYRFKGSDDFSSSVFYVDIKKNIYDFLETEVKIPLELVEGTYIRLKKDYSGHISIGIEREYGIDRNRFFQATWDLAPEKYIDPTNDPLLVLSKLKGRAAILTGAPRIWAERALRFLGVYTLIKDNLFTGEPDIRKPSEEVFTQVGRHLMVPFSSIYSVGDQEDSDILTAKAIGMRTVKVGGGETAADYQISKLTDLHDLLLENGL